MAILGLLLLLAVGGLAVDVVVQNTSSISVEAVGTTFTMSPGWLFVVGLATGVIALLGLSLLLAGITRTRRRRADLAQSRDNLQGLQAERDRLAVELQRERAARTSMTVGSRRHEPAANDDESAVIDLADDRQSERASTDYAAVTGTTGRESAADKREPVESGRRGLLHRRH
jgi:hypothetical protein